MDAIETTVDLPMDEAEAAVRAALGEQGFGVLTEIDVAATLKAKIDHERAPLKILGACNPVVAKDVLEVDPSAALLLPCNVVLEPAAGGGTRVAVADPRALLSAPGLDDLACSAADRLQAALDALG